MIMRIICLCIIFGYHAHQSRAQNSDHQRSLKVLSYNILEGFSGDSIKLKGFSDWVMTVNPDVIALQEVNHYTQGELEKLAHRLGYSYAVLLREKGYPPALLSRYPITHVQRVTDNMLHGFLYAKIQGHHFVVLHLNPFSYEKRNIEIDLVLSHLAAIQKKEPVLIMGDFNSLSPEDSSFYRNTGKLEMLKGVEQTKPHIRNLNKGKIDYSVIQKMLGAGYTDVWKHTHRGQYEKSAPSKVLKSTPSNDMRIDYIWISRPFRGKIRESYIVKDHLTDTLSDHYPMILILNR